jgi:hypothetical protein
MGLAVGGVGGWLVQAFPDIVSNLIAAAIRGVLVWSATNARRRLKLVRAQVLAGVGWLSPVHRAGCS